MTLSFIQEKQAYSLERNTRNIVLTDLFFFHFLFRHQEKNHKLQNITLKEQKSKKTGGKLQFSLNRKKNQLSSLIFLSYSFFLFQSTLLSLSDFKNANHFFIFFLLFYSPRWRVSHSDTEMAP